MTPRQTVRWGMALVVVVVGAMIDLARPCLAGAYCTGDCNGNGTVSASEFADCRGIAFGSRPLSVCTACDCDLDGIVSETEWMQSQQNSLTGCSASECPRATVTPGITPTSTATLTPIFSTPTRNPTGTRPTATVVPSSTATSPPTATVPAGFCAGDCDNSGQVGVNELVTGVNIALDRTAVVACPSFDADASTTVSVNELVSAVNNLLRGCGN